MNPGDPTSSLTDAYAGRLEALAAPRWKRWLNVQAPYRWNLRRLKPGLLLDVGCGIGRNLKHVGGHGVGVDPNEACVAQARAEGLAVFTPAAFAASDNARAGRFDSLLIAHVLEHIGQDDGAALIASYLPYVRPGGQVVLITPQEAGYASDATHVEFIDADALARIVRSLGLDLVRSYAFPLPRLFGKLFRHNEFVVVARAPG